MDKTRDLAAIPSPRGRWVGLASWGASTLLAAVPLVLVARRAEAPWWGALALLPWLGLGFLIWHLEGRRKRLARSNRELRMLRRAGLSVSSELSLEAVLERLVEQATQLIGTRYGALSVLDEDDTIQTFVTVGIGRAAAAMIGSPPVGRGLLGIPLRQGERLRLDDLSADSRACGFPEHHPVMSSLLAVPLICRSPHRGNLYLTEKRNGKKFDADDVAILTRFAEQAAIAIDNAHLHSQVSSLAVAEERLRLAHELHDGQAQVLAFVNAKAQAVGQFLRSGDLGEAERQLEQLAVAARQVLSEVRVGILGLRSVEASGSLRDNLSQYLDRWQDQVHIAVEARLEAVPELPTGVELQILRILQEALANVRKHSETKRVEVALEPWQDGLRLEVKDFGRGLPVEDNAPDGKPRFGLATMRERAQAISADLEIDSLPQQGTRVRLRYQPKSAVGLRLAGLASSESEGELDENSDRR